MERLKWYQDAFFISLILTSIAGIVTIILYSNNFSMDVKTWSIIITGVLGGVAAVSYMEQCSNCKRIFTKAKISDDIVKEWKERKPITQKTIVYYSDGITVKDVKKGRQIDFTAEYEKHKEGYKCKKCDHTTYKYRDKFVNKNGHEHLIKENTQKVTSKTPVPKEHHTNINTDFDLGSFEPTYYETRAGKRKNIPKSVKMQLWEKYIGKHKAYGKCFVCGQKIHMQKFEAGHVVPAAKGGPDRISNLRPICFGCNRSMGDTNLYEFKKRYHG
jgi:5-methylcytosine-specific restriction endonuclease McrA